jgi:hypothetical protein
MFDDRPRMCPSSEGLISNMFQRLNFRGLGATGGITWGEICVAARMHVGREQLRGARVGEIGKHS